MKNPVRCACPYENLSRTPAPGWVGLLPWLQQYRCLSCSKVHVRRAAKVEAEQARIFYETRVAELERSRH